MYIVIMYIYYNYTIPSLSHSELKVNAMRFCNIPLSHPAFTLPLSSKRPNCQSETTELAVRSNRAGGVPHRGFLDKVSLHELCTCNGTGIQHTK